MLDSSVARRFLRFPKALPQSPGSCGEGRLEDLSLRSGAEAERTDGSRKAPAPRYLAEQGAREVSRGADLRGVLQRTEERVYDNHEKSSSRRRAQRYHLRQCEVRGVVGWSLSERLEGLMVAHVAAALSNEQDEDESLLIEVPFKKIQEWSGAPRRLSRISYTRKDRNRADIALFDQRGRSLYVVEVKRSWVRNSCFKDNHAASGPV